MPDYIIRQRDRGQAEAKTSRPRSKLQGRGRDQSFGLEATLSTVCLQCPVPPPPTVFSWPCLWH